MTSLLSEETCRRVKGLVEGTEKRDVRAKGFRKKVKVFRLNGLKLPAPNRIPGGNVDLHRQPTK